MSIEVGHVIFACMILFGAVGGGELTLSQYVAFMVMTESTSLLPAARYASLTQNLPNLQVLYLLYGACAATFAFKLYNGTYGSGVEFILLFILTISAIAARVKHNDVLAELHSVNKIT